MSALTQISKGDTVIMKAFTGMRIGVFPVIKTTKKTITVEGKKGLMTFNISDGVQVEPEPSAPRYANSIIPDDGSFVPHNRQKKKPAPAKKAKKKAEPEPEPEVEEPEPEDIDEDEEEMAKAAKKAKKSSKKSKKKPEPEPEPEYDDDDEFEEVD